VRDGSQEKSMAMVCLKEDLVFSLTKSVRYMKIGQIILASPLSVRGYQKKGFFLNG
jgi:hypothetical protein